MPIWSEIAQEIKEESTPLGFDRIRRKYLKELSQHSGRQTILYATGWLQKQLPPSATSIGDEDMQGLMEVCYELEGDSLDLILHSPGGSAEAAEAIVQYLRCRFPYIRVIVPHVAMSAATIIACAADEIVLGEHSSLGPIDPQLILQTSVGPRVVPAQAILDQFNQAKKECGDPKKFNAWVPMLNQYGPDLLVQCESALSMSKELVENWLKIYMFKKEKNPSELAREVAAWLADHKHFKSHGRHISREQAESHKLKVIQLEEDKKLEDLVLSIYHATTHTFAGTSAVKIIENHIGRAFIKLSNPPPQ